MADNQAERRELAERILEVLIEDPEATAHVSIDQARAELLSMGLDPDVETARVKVALLSVFREFDKATPSDVETTSDSEFATGSSNTAAEEDQQAISDTIVTDGNAYVRCPEVAWASHGPQSQAGGILPSHDRTVKSVLDHLDRNNQNVITLPEIGPRSVASALVHLAATMGRGHEFPAATLVHKLSWWFIRVSDMDEALDDDVDFWRLMWQLMGASDQELEQFQVSPTRQDAVAQLQTILSRFDGDAEAPHSRRRAPDVIVLIGTNVLEQRYRQNREATAEALAVAGVLEDIRKQNDLPVSPDRRDSERLYRALGRTRLILLPHDTRDDLERDDQFRLRQSDWEHLRLLGAFRWSFAEKTATTLLRKLKAPEEDVGAVLECLRRKDALREFKGRYHIPYSLRSQVLGADADASPARLAFVHWTAATSIAPSIGDEKTSSLELGAVLKPDIDAEAAFHLGQAFCLWHQASVPRNEDSIAFAAAIHRSYHWLALGEMLGSCIHKPISIAMSASAGKSTPLHFLRPARPECLFPNDPGSHTGSNTWMNWTLTYLLLAPKDDESKDRVKHGELISSWEGTNESSELFAVLFRYIERMPALEELIWSCLMDRSSQEALRKRLSAVSPQLKSYLCDVSAVWLDRRGDETTSAREAADAYALGIELAPSWHGLPFKGLGASQAAQVRIEAIEEWLRTLDEDEAASIHTLRDARRCFERDRVLVQRGEKRKDVLGYWQRAAEYLRSRWGNRRPDFIEFASGCDAAIGKNASYYDDN